MLVNLQERPTRLIGLTSADAMPSDVVAGASCDGMGKVTGSVLYSAAPATNPTVEFSNNGINWGWEQQVPADPSSVVANTAFDWSIPVVSWRYVRVTLPAAGGGATANANVELWSRNQS